MKSNTRFRHLVLETLKRFTLLGVVCVWSTASFAEPFKAGKRVIEVAPLSDSRIVLPDGKIHDVGINLITALKTKFFQSNQWVVTEPRQEDDDLEWSHRTPQSKGLASRNDPSFIWSGGYFPAARIKLSVLGFTFESGLRGNRMVYGFDDRFNTPFNDGGVEVHEEFAQEPGEFGATFDKKGRTPFDSLSGLDLGDGFEVDLIAAWLKLKYAYYESWLFLDVQVDSPLTGHSQNRTIKVRGRGFFMDLAGSYAGYSAQIALGRTDAVLQALKRAVKKSTQAVYEMLGPMPLTAKVDFVQDGLVFLGTGKDAQVPVGTRYQSVKNPETIVVVDESTFDGSIARVVSGQAVESIAVGAIFVEEGGLETGVGIDPQGFAQKSRNGQTLKVVQTIEAKEFDNLVPLPGQQDQFQNEKQQLLAWLKKISELVFLPYRIFRYFKYDQAYHQKSDALGRAKAKDLARKLASAAPSDSSFSPSPFSPVIAVIDTGVDYNHPALHDSLWTNPAPTTDLRTRMDRYGWDFVGGDSRPFDDHYHGTQTAYAIALGAASVGSRVKIMPLKVFNPWGITRSSALYAAFDYAIAHGAHAIVCAWSTTHETESLREAVALAARAQVPVFVSAGDEVVDIAQKPRFPSDFESVFVVGAVKDKKSVAGFSSDKVDVVVEIAERLAIAEPRGGWVKAKNVKSQASLGVGFLTGKMMGSWASQMERGLLPGRLDWERFLDQNAKIESWAQGFSKFGRIIKVE